MKWHFTQHALQRMAKRQLRQEWVERAVNSPARIEPDETDATLEHRRVQLDTVLKSWAGETPALLWRRSRQQRRTARPACPGKGEIPFTVRP